MPTAEEFDEFYLGTRRRLLLQTFALTGDLGAARTAVRDAYVAARHHWSKVGRSSDPEAWVRPRAWAAAQRRHTVRVWHRERGIRPEQATVLEALHELTDQQRRVLLLDRLVALDLPAIGREIGQTRERTQALLDSAEQVVSAALGVAPDRLGERLRSLQGAADTIKLPRAQIIRRNGLRRRRQHSLIGSLVIGAIAVAAGAFVSGGSEPAVPTPSAASLVSPRLLLTTAQVVGLGNGAGWQADPPSNNTTGSGINTTCQGARFADPNGIGTWVQRFTSLGTGAAPSLVQTVEISRSADAARAAYRTTLGWYAGCTLARLQLLDAARISGIGDEAEILRMRIPDRTPRSILIGIARTGSLTTSVVLETATQRPAAAALMATALAGSVADLCSSKVAGTCTGPVTSTPTLPLAPGETPGMLAIADLPAIASINYPWIGTDPVDATVNVAATTCDRADFGRAGAVHPIARTYLIPQAQLPQRFGLTETIGRFSSARAAIAFVNTIVERMRTCQRRELGSTVSHQIVTGAGVGGATYAMWRLEVQVNKAEDRVPFWMGIARAGRYVAQVNLTPVKQYDVSEPTFRGLIARARDRLFEVH